MWFLKISIRFVISWTTKKYEKCLDFLSSIWPLFNLCSKFRFFFKKKGRGVSLDGRKLEGKVRRVKGVQEARGEDSRRHDATGILDKISETEIILKIH